MGKRTWKGFLKKRRVGEGGTEAQNQKEVFSEESDKQNVSSNVNRFDEQNEPRAKTKNDPSKQATTNHVDVAFDNVRKQKATSSESSTWKELKLPINGKDKHEKHSRLSALFGKRSQVTKVSNLNVLVLGIDEEEDNWEQVNPFLHPISRMVLTKTTSIPLKSLSIPNQPPSTSNTANLSPQPPPKRPSRHGHPNLNPPPQTSSS
jgi:hypothetical protein